MQTVLVVLIEVLVDELKRVLQKRFRLMEVVQVELADETREDVGLEVL